MSFFGFALFILRLHRHSKRLNEDCADGDWECRKQFLKIAGMYVGGVLLLYFAGVLIRRGLVG